MTTQTAPAPSEATRLLDEIGKFEARAEPVIRAAWQDRQVPGDVAEEMTVLGFFRMLTPRAIGGLELEPWQAAEVVERLARIDGTLGWLAMIASQSGWYASFLPEDVAREVAGPESRLAGSLRPGGRAIRAVDGYDVSGRWRMVSGSPHATWLYGTVALESSNGAPSLRMVFLPAGEATLIDTWHTTGLRGTASGDFAVREVFVPEERTLAFPTLPEPWAAGPLYRDRYQNLAFLLQAGQALGMARGSLDAFAGMTAETGRWLGKPSLRDDATVQRAYAESEASVLAARAFAQEAAREAWERIIGGDPPTTEQRLRLRLAISHAVTTSRDVATRLAGIAGAAAIYEGHPLHQRAQDLAAAAAHVQAAPVMFETAGALALGALAVANEAIL